MRTWQCRSVTCNCGIAAREGDDVIILDMCWDGIPRIRFASKKTPAEGTSVTRDPTGKSFIVSRFCPLIIARNLFIKVASMGQ